MLDVDSLLRSFLKQHSSSIESLLSRNGFQWGSQLSVSRELYAIENPNILYLTFKSEFECDDTTGEGRLDGKLLLKGDGSYNIDNNSFIDSRNRGLELSFRLKDGGTRLHRSIVPLTGSIVIGHKDIFHEVRFELD